MIGISKRMDSSPEEVTLKREEGSQGAEAREVAPGAEAREVAPEAEAREVAPGAEAREVALEAEAREVAPGETLVDEVVKVNLVVGDKEEDHEVDLAVIEVDPAVVEADLVVAEVDLAEAGEKDDPKVN